MKKIFQEKKLGTAVVFAVVLAFVLPITTANAYDETSGNISRDYIKSATPMVFSAKPSLGTDIALTMAGIDRMPSVTRDAAGHTVVTWTNEEELTVWNMGIAYSDDPTVQESWTGWAIALDGTTMLYSADTAYVTGSLPTDYSGLYGVDMYYDTEEAGYYKIADITADPSTWEYYSWTNGAPEPVYSCVSDMGYYGNKYYPAQFGPFNFYIYHEIYSTYDIVGCPICFHNDLRGGAGGVGFFDGQSFEKTAPASDPDIVDLGDRFHTCIQYTNTTTGPHIVWKKVVPAEEPDYEFTAYQDTVADGKNPEIAAYKNGSANHVAIVYVNGTNVKCINSNNDGANWSAPVTIHTGSYPAIYAIGTQLYCCYIDGGNLYLVKSYDGGATWGAAEKINDVDGSVVTEENSVDIHLGGIAWVDNRGDDIDIYLEPFEFAPPTAPKMEIGAITGGLGKVGCSIKNIGTANATNITWSITVKGGILKRINITTQDTIPSLEIGKNVSISTDKFIWGLGAISISVKASCPEAMPPSVEKTAAGKVLLFFVRL